MELGGGADDWEALRSPPAVKSLRAEARELVFAGLKRQLMETEQIFCCRMPADEGRIRGGFK